MLYISIILFLISFGSVRLHRTKNHDAMIENYSYGKLILTIISILPFIMIFFSVDKLWNLKWYWSILFSISFTLLLSNLLAILYSSFLGFKTKPQFSLIKGGYIKHNIHIIDTLITFVIGTIIFFIS